jgi:hypothetical protein
LTPLLRVIELKFVVPIENLRDFRHEYQHQYGGTYKKYTEDDAKEYFDWLVGIVAGIEKVPNDIFKTAVEQLFTFLYHMRLNTVTDKDPFTTPTMEAQIALLRSQMVKLTEKIEARDKEITGLLELMKRWFAENGPIMKWLKEEYENRGKIGKP